MTSLWMSWYWWNSDHHSWSECLDAMLHRLKHVGWNCIKILLSNNHSALNSYFDTPVCQLRLLIHSAVASQTLHLLSCFVTYRLGNCWEDLRCFSIRPSFFCPPTYSLWPRGWIMGLRLSLRVLWGQGGASLLGQSMLVSLVGMGDWGPEKEPCLQTVHVYIPNGKRQF